MRSAERRVRINKQNRMQETDCELSPPHSELRTGSIYAHHHERQSKDPNSKGFTLIEIVITIVLVSILAGIAAMIILQGVKMYSDEQSRSDVHYQARIAMERMAREIRVIRSAADITTFTTSTLRFTDISGAALGFEWTNPTLSRFNGVGNDVLASGVNPFSFSYFENDGVTPAVLVDNVWFVEIDMTSVQGVETMQMKTRVHPRNFW